ncbi:MAG: Glu/Leu/Phe/Val dehydrogenase dimerization domain-containing protein [Actinomycetota bacterium]
MKLHKLTSTTAWAVLDLEDVPCFGPTTLGPKVLQVNAKLHARAQTYRFALLGEQLGGGAGGIKVDQEQRSDAVAAFVSEGESEYAAAKVFHTEAGWGLSDDELAPLHAHDPRNPAFREHADALHAAGLVAAAAVAMGGVEGRTLSLGHLSPAVVDAAAQLVDGGALVTAVAHRGAGSVDVAGHSADRLGAMLAGEERGEADADAVVGVDTDLYVPAAGLRSIDHDTAAAVGAGAVLGATDLVVTPRAVADLRARQVEVWPEWVARIGPTMAGLADGDTPVDELVAAVGPRVTDVLRDARDHEDGPIIGACIAAEDFLRTWRDELPFGRPLP